MRGDDGVFIFSISHIGQKGVCLLFFEFYEEIQKLFTRAFPPRTPPHPKLKIWGSSRGNNIALLLRVWVLKKEENTNVLQNSYLCTRIAIRFFLNAFINLSALQAAVEIAANALYNWDIHLISSSVARSTSDRSSIPSRVRSGSYVSSSSVRASFSISASSKSHRVFFVTNLPKITKHFFRQRSAATRQINFIKFVANRTDQCPNFSLIKIWSTTSTCSRSVYYGQLCSAISL